MLSAFTLTDRSGREGHIEAGSARWTAIALPIPDWPPSRERTMARNRTAVFELRYKSRRQTRQPSRAVR
jgi:hypothetical protein